MRSPSTHTAEYSAIRIATALGARCNTLHAPAVLSTPDIAAALRREQVIAEQLRQFDDLDAIAFTLGGAGATAHIVQAGLLEAAELAKLRDDGAAGVLCGRLIDARGAIMDAPLRQRMIAVSEAQIRAAPKRLAIVGGVDRLGPLRAALEGSWITHLVVDDELAAALLDA